MLKPLLGPPQVHCWELCKATVGTCTRSLLGPAQGHCWDQHKSTVGTSTGPMLGPPQCHCWELCKATVGTSTRPVLGTLQGHCWDLQKSTVGTSTRPLLGPAQGHRWDQHKATVGTCTNPLVAPELEVRLWDLRRYLGGIGAREMMESAEFAILRDQYNVQLRNRQRFAGGNGDFSSFQIAGSYFLSLSPVVNECRRRWKTTVAMAGACPLR